MGRPPRSLVIPLLSFALVLLVATFFVGDIGVYNDDYFCAQIDPVTGQPTGYIMNRPWHLWRPLTRVTLIPLVTALWGHPWVLHLIDAGLHALVVGLLYSLLRSMRVRPGIAGAAAMAFMIYPAYFEAVLWIDITCTLMSVAIVLGIWRTYVWWLGTAHQLAPAARGAVLVGLGVGAFCAAGMNEQPPGALAALPLTVLAVGWATADTARRRFVRTFFPVAAVAIGLLAYLWGFFHYTPVAKGPGQLERRTESLHVHGLELMAKIPRELGLMNFASGAWKAGLATLQEHPARAVLAGVALALVAVWFVGSRSKRPPQEDADRPRPGALALIGAAWFVTAWIPVALSHAYTNPRLHYPPAIGLAFIAGAILSAIPLGRGVGSRVGGAVARVAFALFVGVAAVMWIGCAANYQKRWRADHAEIEPLARVFGPTLEPGCFLIPISIDSRVAHTGAVEFDSYFQHCWFWEFAAGWRAQLAMRNSTVCTPQTEEGVGGGLWLYEPDPRAGGLIRMKLANPKPPDLAQILPEPHDRQGRLLSWDRAVFFRIEGAGNTRIYTKVRLHPAGAEPIEVVPRQVAIAPPAAALPELVLDVYPMPPDQYRDHMGPHPPKKKSQR